MEARSLNYLSTMSQLLRDYAESRLVELKIETQMLEGWLGGGAMNTSAPQSRPQRSPHEISRASALRERIEQELRDSGMELRPTELAHRLRETGWQFRNDKRAATAIATALGTSNVVVRRKSGPARRAAVFYSIRNGQ